MLRNVMMRVMSNPQLMQRVVDSDLMMSSMLQTNPQVRCLARARGWTRKL